jgi:hypothetical protein
MHTWVDVAWYLSFLYKPYQKKVPKSITIMAYPINSTNISQTLNPNTSFKSQWSTYPNRTNEFGNIPLGTHLVCVWGGPKSEHLIQVLVECPVRIGFVPLGTRLGAIPSPGLGRLADP